MIRNNNPVFKKMVDLEYDYSDGVATYKGVMAKTFIYLGCTLLGAILGFVLMAYFPTIFTVGLTFSGLFTFIFGIVAMSAPRHSKVCGILYCISEGSLLGFLSLVYESVVGGVVLATLVSTFSVLLVVCTLYMSGLVKVNNKFARFTLTFVVSVMVSQLILFLLSVFTGLQFNFTINLVSSLIMIFIACLYLLMDLQQIVNVVESGLPKQYEWFASFGLVFTILWLYAEILPIIAQVLDNRN